MSELEDRIQEIRRQYRSYEYYPDRDIWVDQDGNEVSIPNWDEKIEGFKFLENHPKGSRKWRVWAGRNKKEF